MSVDTALYVGDFDVLKPAGSDPAAELDNSDRQIKAGLVNSFPNVKGPVTANHTELSYVDGVTSAIQTQLDSKGAIAGQTWTGTHDFTGASLVVATPTTGTQAASKAYTDALVITSTAPTFTATTTATSKTLVAFEACTITASSQTLTLPASPTSGQTVCRIRTRSGISTTVGRNGKPIMGLAEDMTIPFGNATVTLAYQDATEGWILL